MTTGPQVDGPIPAPEVTSVDWSPYRLARLLRQFHVFAIWRILVFNAGIAWLIGRKSSQTIWPIGLVFLLGALLQSVSG